MKRTFLVTLELDNTDSPEIIAQDILEELQDAGFQVQTVNPWASPISFDSTSGSTNPFSPQPWG